MRLFVSVEPSAEALRSLEAVVGSLRPQVRGARWTGPERWHLTLAFLGEVAEEVAPRVAAELAAAARPAGPIQLRVAGGGTFPPRGRPRVLWAGLDGQTDELGRLARAVGRGVRHAGVRLERRQFRAHVTLARFRDRDADARAAVRTLAGYAGPWFTIDELHFVRSYLGPNPRHEKLDSWSLAGA